MPNNPLTQEELYEYGILRTLTPSPEIVGIVSPYMPKGYFLVPPHDVNGEVQWRLFDAGYIATGIVDPNRLGTGSTGTGNLYLADDGTWKAVGGSNSQDLDSVTDLGNTTTNSINVGGITTDYVQLDTTATPTLQEGMFAWNSADGTADLRLKGNNVTLQLGQENVVRVVNKTGANLLESEYKVVRIRIASEGGAQGQRLAVVLAQGNNDPDSVTTLGVVTEDIGNNQEGFITVFGNVNGINTTGSLQGETWVDGDVLYLSPTIPGRLTKVKPTAPNHTVTVGYVVYAHANQGKIFVKVDNGYEIGELHDVYINNPTDGQIIKYNASNSRWENYNNVSNFKIDYDYNIVGARDGSNTNFSTTSNFKSGTTRVYLNGQRLTPGIGYDYVEASANQISLFYSPVPSDRLIIEYELI